MSDEKLDAMISAHWSYIKALLTVHGETPEIITKIGFHYRTAMLHGYKHAVQNGDN